MNADVDGLMRDRMNLRRHLARDLIVRLMYAHQEGALSNLDTGRDECRCGKQGGSILAPALRGRPARYIPGDHVFPIWIDFPIDLLKHAYGDSRFRPQSIPESTQ